MVFPYSFESLSRDIWSKVLAASANEGATNLRALATELVTCSISVSAM